MITTIVTSLADYQRQAREAQEIEMYVAELAYIIPGLKVKEIVHAFERFGFEATLEFAKKHGKLP